MAKRYTAQEMRDMAENIIMSEDDWIEDAAHMLRQAADEMERIDEVNKAIGDELKKQEHCRKCEWRGKSVRSEPACPCDEDVHGVVFDIGVTDRIVKALRGDLEREEREKKYEYAARSNYDGFIDPEHCEESELEHTFSCMKCDEYTVVRREVGEWEEVE